MLSKLSSLPKLRGFTLMELLIVIAIIAILMVSFLPNALKAPAKARDSGRIKTINDMAILIESYMAEKGAPPASAANVPFCLDVDGGDGGVPADFASLFKGGKFPTDNSNLRSCGDENKKNAYFYRYNGVDKFYVIAARVEVAASANSSAVLNDLEVGNRVLFEGGGNPPVAGKLGKPGDAVTPYYVVVGP